MVDRVGLAAGEGLRHEHVDSQPVLGVHHDHRAHLLGNLHGAQDLTVIRIEHARVGHEQLEAGDPFVFGELGHGLECRVIHAADDLVEGVVDGTLAVRLGVPCGQPVEDGFALPLDREIDDRRGAAPRCRARPALERV